MLEKVVAEMHQQAGAVTETNVQLSPVRNAKGVKREIDVLVTTRVVNQEVRIAFECKNEKKLTGTQDIDVFARKLEYVGIPVRCGVFVSVAGYTKGALQNAEDCGIKALLYEDVNKTLPHSIINAIQSVLYVLCEVTDINLKTPTILQSEGSGQLRIPPVVFVEVNDQVHQIYLGDMLWHMWAVEGSLPDSLGEHEVELPVPHGAFILHEGQRYPVLFEPSEYLPRARILVSGCVFSVEGKTKRHLLTNARNNTAENFQVSVEFDPNAEPTVQIVSTEEEFQELTKPNGRMQLVAERFRLPRIIWRQMFWPPSKRVLDILRSKAGDFESSAGPDPEMLEFGDVEGVNLASVWESISPEWPLYRHYHQSESPQVGE